MNKGIRNIAALGCLAAVLGAPGTSRGDASSPPPVIHFCSANCFTLVLKGGQYVREDGTLETWTVERFTTDSVILHRHDAPAVWNGYKTDVPYAGRASNDRLVDLTVEGQPAPSMSMAWGSALASVPANNAERDHPGQQAMRQPFGRSGLSAIGAGPSARQAPPMPAAPASPVTTATTTEVTRTPAPATIGADQTFASKIFVLTGGRGMNSTELLAYNSDGATVAPHILLGKEKSAVMAADARGVLYVSHNDIQDYVVAAYQPDGNLDPRFPKIPALAQGLAVSPSGNLYVLEQVAPLHARTTTGVVRTYAPDGHPLGAAINVPMDGPTCLAVDAAGTVYVAASGDNLISSFTPNGQRTALAIHEGISRPLAIAVDPAGKIYVVNSASSTLTTYAHDGQRTTPTITTFEAPPSGVALDASGHIYVGVGSKIGIYSANGALIKLVADIPGGARSLALH